MGQTNGPCKRAAEWLVNALPAAALFEFVRRSDLEEELFRGFRVNRRNAGRKVVRNHVGKHVAHHARLCELFLECPGTPWQHWKCAFDTVGAEQVRSCWRDLIRATEKKAIAAALAASEDAALQRRGWRLLRRPSFWGNPRLKTADLPVPWDSILALAEETASNAASEIPEALRQKHEGERRRLEHEIADLRRALDHHREQAKTAETRAEAAEKARQQEAAHARRKQKDLESSYRELNEHFEEHLEQRIQQYRQRVLGVSRQHQTAVETIRAGGSASLLKQLQESLARHRRVNEAYGTLSEIRDEIKRLEDAEADITHCLAECVEVDDDLFAIRDNIEERLSHLRSLLPRYDRPAARKGSGTVQRTFAFIKSATPDETGETKLAAMDQFLDNPTTAQVFTDDDLAALKAAVEDRRQRLETLKTERAMADASPPDAGPSAGPAIISDIHRELARRQDRPVRIIVDGYNVIKRTRALAAVEEEDGLAAARRTFCEQCEAAFGHTADVEIVFDGTGHMAQRETVGGVTVVFAPHKRDSQNADDYICERLETADTSADRQWLVTDDEGLRIRTEPHCDGFVAVADLAAQLAGTETI